MNFVLSEEYSKYKKDIIKILKNFKNEGVFVGHCKRNIVKCFQVNDVKFNVKSFKQHNLINRHVYKYYRKSKSRRSYEYGKMLLQKGFYTPKPIAFVENYDFVGVTSSYYVSEQLEDSFLFTEVIMDPNYVDRETIIRFFTKLIFQLHENGIIFIDNASGNFLIKKIGEEYRFYLVDLNRMSFYDHIDISKRLKNFDRLEKDIDITETLKIIGSEYAKLSGYENEFCVQKIINFTNKKKLKMKIKNLLKFYKKF